MSLDDKKIDENQSLPLQIAQAYWDQSVPQAMDMNCGDPPCLDQIVSQTIAKIPSDITPWSWVDPLSPFLLTWTTGEKQQAKKHTSWLGACPIRNVRIDHHIRAGVVDVDVTERYRAIAEVLSKPIGDFQANKFFEFLATLDTKAISQLVEAVRTLANSQHDEAAYLRCMLLSEVMVDGAKMMRMTHVASRFALDTYITKVESHIGAYGDQAANGSVAAVDLWYFAARVIRKATYPGRCRFGIDTWGSQTAVVPVQMKYSGSRAVLPYMLSFVTTTYWTQRVGYNVTVKEMGVASPRVFQVDCLSRAGQALVGGPEDVLLVVIEDVEVHPGDSVKT